MLRIHIRAQVVDYDVPGTSSLVVLSERIVTWQCRTNSVDERYPKAPHRKVKSQRQKVFDSTVYSP